MICILKVSFETPSFQPSGVAYGELVGVAVSSTGRKFSSYARALDPNNIAYTVAELIGEDKEVPFPSAEFNTPPGGAINYSVTPAVSANYHDHLIGAQSVVVDPLNRLWIIDTGRAITNDGIVNPASEVSDLQGFETWQMY